MAKKKYYVVWVGIEPGVYDNWEDAAEQVLTFPGAKYKSYPSLNEAIKAYRGDDSAEAGALLQLFTREKPIINYEAFPEIDTSGIAVDAACSGNPGPMEYRGVEIATGKEIFRKGPFPQGTNNIGEYLALVHAISLCAQRGEHTRPIYSDSVTAQKWLRGRHSRSKLIPNEVNAQLLSILARADAWVATHTWANPIRKWDTDNWGEIPADFNRK